MNFIDDGKYIWQDVFKEMKGIYEEEINDKNKSYKEKYEIALLIKNFIYDTIHNKLVPNRQVEGVENSIRILCKYVISKVLVDVTKIIGELNVKAKEESKKKNLEIILLLDKYYDLEDDLYAIASFRSLMHFAHYMERSDDKSQLVWKYNMKNTMGGIFYYSNQMILNNKYHNLIKQTPTGYGKCVDSNTLVDVYRNKEWHKIKIKNIKIGDLVTSMKDNQVVKRKVTHKWESRRKAIKIKTLSGREIIVSELHRLYTQKGYIMSCNLTIQDYLYVRNGSTFTYDEIMSIENMNKEIDMIDIEVEETHNYLANDLVSHNSKSDTVIISFCFGYDVNDDIVKVVGNKTLVKPNTHAVVTMLKSKRFGKVFPEYGKYNGENAMFKNCSETDGTFTLKDSKKSQSFLCINKETAFDGARFNKQFYDDITQSKDRENVNAHNKDINDYESMWKKRCYDEFSCLRWFTGTAYHRQDFLSYIKRYYSNNEKLIKDNNTIMYKWNKFVMTNEKQDTVYISIPKLADLDLGEDKCYCTFPEKYSKESALKDLHSSMVAKRRFYAMEQQKPLPPENLPFDYMYLIQYKELPEKIMDNYCETKMIIDPSRTGRDNYAALIFKRMYDDEDTCWYLVDCFYKPVTSKIAIPKICERAKFHKVKEIIFESNTVDTYQMQKDLKQELSKINYSCEINNFYSTKNKESKISDLRDDLRIKIKYPREGMYHYESDMGRAMSDITNYSLVGSNAHDDSIDCCASLLLLDEKKIKNEIFALNINL